MKLNKSILILYAGFWLFAFISNSSQAQQIYISPDEVNTSIGASFTVDVMVSSITDLSAFEFRISFDETILDAVSVVKGALWNDSNYLWHTGQIDNSSGSIGFTSGAASSGSGPTGVSVDANGGILATITFQTNADGTSPVDLADVLMCYVNGNTVSTGVTNGTVTTNLTLSIPFFAGWNMASCPGEPVNGDVATLVNGTPVLPQIYTWIPANQDYSGPVDTIQFGVGYWFPAIADAQLDIECEPRDTMTVQLTAGWNMVGSVSGDVPVTSLTSVPAGAVLTSSIYRWNVAIGNYEVVGTIVPGGGYWIPTIADAELTMDSTQAPAAPPAQVRIGVDMIKPSWESVIAIQTQSQRQQLTFGMHPSASGGFDRLLDKPNPPLSVLGSNALKASWMINDTYFSLLNESFVGDSAHANWELSVELSEPGELRWSHLPTAYRCLLKYDEQMIQMQDVESIYLPEGHHTLTLVLDSFASLPKRTQLLANYPNPFNPETWIPYHLSDDGDVTLVIYDMSGREVRQFHLGNQLAGEYQDKEHALHWDGRNHVGETVSSGVYFYSLQTYRVSQTRKLVVIR